MLEEESNAAGMLILGSPRRIDRARYVTNREKECYECYEYYECNNYDMNN